jgi:hypothetical protein
MSFRATISDGVNPARTSATSVSSNGSRAVGTGKASTRKDYNAMSMGELQRTVF